MMFWAMKNTLLTTIQAGEMLNVSRKMIIKLINEGRITAEKLGRDYVISRDEVERYQRERKPAGRPSASEKTSTTKRKAKA
jgi:excisionase family DNA binding protein